MSRPVTANAIDLPARWTASGSANVERTVRSAGRHSRMVRVVRVLLPAAIALGLGGYALFNYLNPMAMLRSMPSVSGKLAVQGSKITMELPRIAGFTRDSRAYELNAETAVQDIAKPDLVDRKSVV